MGSIEEKYKQLTNVDIAEQARLWNERGKGYYGEYLVFCDLYKYVNGNCKILMNLHIPTKNGKSTEIDLLMIHETGIYVFEVKHFKGTIYGDDNGQIWTQYFRTTKNSVFKNPVLQNQYHLTALRELLGDVPVKSIIVFTSEDCELRVNVTRSDITLCRLSYLRTVLNDRLSNLAHTYTMEDIDKLFNELSKYSKMQEPVLYSGEEKTFNSWVEPIISNFRSEKSNLEIEAAQYKNTLELESKKYKILFIITLIISIILFITTILGFGLCVFTNSFNDNTSQNNTNSSISYPVEINNYVSVSNVLLTQNANSTNFTATLALKNNSYVVKLNENSQYIVTTNNHIDFKYNVFGENLLYNEYSNTLSYPNKVSGKLADISFEGISKDEITYIGLTNVTVFKNDNNNMEIQNGEIELYSK